ncbi:UNVERIFIED_CONTAM: hypothetical protein FKN15_037850 [Acipenser sinensis]
MSSSANSNVSSVAETKLKTTTALKNKQKQRNKGIVNVMMWRLITGDSGLSKRGNKQRASGWPFQLYSLEIEELEVGIMGCSLYMTVMMFMYR